MLVDSSELMAFVQAITHGDTASALRLLTADPLLAPAGLGRRRQCLGVTWTPLAVAPAERGRRTCDWSALKALTPRSCGEI